MFTKTRLMYLTSILLTVVGAQAKAVCQPVVHYSYVGTKATDPNCNFNTVQEAIDGMLCPGTIIVVTNEQAYAGQAITIANKSLTMVGVSGMCGNAGPPLCDPDIGCGGGPPPPQIALGGDGAHSVLTISGSSNVTLANLSISGGLGPPNLIAGAGGVRYSGSGQLILNNTSVHHNSGSGGGGVAFYGDGSLRLDGVSLHDNYASSGGGGVSAFSSFIGHVELIVVDDAAQSTEIASNHARSRGGGIYAGGNTHLLVAARAPGRISIHDNLAGEPALNIGGNGGGIAFEGTAFADIALPGASGLYANTATIGGGISIGASTDGNAALRVFSTNAALPTDIAGNIASSSGGALYVGGGNASVHPTACLFDAALSGNHAAQTGAAIALGDGGRLVVNPDANADCNFSAVTPFGAVHCDPAVSACNRIRQNAALNGIAATDAATIDFTGAAQISARRLRLSGNSGGNVIRGQYATGASVAFSDCLIDHNAVTAQLVNLQFQSAPISFDGCTFADDSIGATTVFSYDTGLILARGIVHEAVQVLNPDAPGLSAQYLLFNAPKLPLGNTVSDEDPFFVNGPGGDYHLQAFSPAIDYAPTGSAALSGDFDRQPREVDLAGVTNRFGARDLGPYESQVGGVSDRIFLGTFD